MKVLVVGLGLMGGAYCYRLMEKGYTVYGADTNPESVEYALRNSFINEGGVDAKKFIPLVDMIILAIYPQAILSFLNENKDLFKENQIVTDICGVKKSFVPEAVKLAKPAIYCSHHPMAGREKVGIKYAKECVFSGANFIVTPTREATYYAIEKLKELGANLGFRRISVIDIEKHDRMIGFTSQLAHAIAVALVNSDHDEDTKNYIGDSYRDLTRIAMINEALWSELFLENKDNLLRHIISFEYELDKLKFALANDDKEALKELFKASTKTRKDMEK